MTGVAERPGIGEVSAYLAAWWLHLPNGQDNTDLQSQTAVTAYLKSKQVLYFCFARQNMSREAGRRYHQPHRSLLIKKHFPIRKKQMFLYSAYSADDNFLGNGACYL